MIIREGIGWFTLKLYTSHDDEIQTTDAYIDMSDSVDIDLTTEKNINADIDLTTEKNINADISNRRIDIESCESSMILCFMDHVIDIDIDIGRTAAFGWFTLKLYIDMSDSVDIDLTTEKNINADIDLTTEKNINADISNRRIDIESCESSMILCFMDHVIDIDIDIGRTAAFGGDVQNEM